MMLCPSTFPIWFDIQCIWLPRPETVTSLTLWHIWKGKNKACFESTIPNHREIATIIKQASEEFLSSLQSKPPCTCQFRPAQGAKNWCPPVEGTIKIITDASFDSDSGKGFGVIILRDHKEGCAVGTP